MLFFFFFCGIRSSDRGYKQRIKMKVKNKPVHANGYDAILGGRASLNGTRIFIINLVEPRETRCYTRLHTRVSNATVRSGERARRTYCLRSFRGWNEFCLLQTFGMSSIVCFYLCCAFYSSSVFSSILFEPFEHSRSVVACSTSLLQKGLFSFSLCCSCGQRIFSRRLHRIKLALHVWPLIKLKLLA